jgi:hypothetical protein
MTIKATLVQPPIEGKRLAVALRVLAKQDVDLARAWEVGAPPPPRARRASPPWGISSRRTGLHRLHRAIAARLEVAAGTIAGIDPGLGEEGLRAVGFAPEGRSCPRHR